MLQLVLLVQLLRHLQRLFDMIHFDGPRLRRRGAAAARPIRRAAAAVTAARADVVEVAPSLQPPYPVLPPGADAPGPVRSSRRRRRRRSACPAAPPPGRRHRLRAGGGEPFRAEESLDLFHNIIIVCRQQSLSSDSLIW